MIGRREIGSYGCAHSGQRDEDSTFFGSVGGVVGKRVLLVGGEIVTGSGFLVKKDEMDA